MSNIFQVVKEDHIDNILKKNSKKLVVLMITMNGCGACVKIKPFYYQLSKKYNDYIFLFINVHNFNVTEGKYTNDLNYFPTFKYYFGLYDIGRVEGANQKKIEEVILVFKQRLEKSMNHSLDNPTNNTINNPTNNTTNNPTNDYSNDSLQNTKTQNLEERKMNQLKQLEELEKKRYMIQMHQLYRLQQLQNMRQVKNN